MAKKKISGWHAFLAKLHLWIRKRSFAKLWNEYKQWIRQSTTGRVFDRFTRFFIITLVSTFFANYALGSQVIPMLQLSATTAFVAAFDKAKNEWNAYVRSVE